MCHKQSVIYAKIKFVQFKHFLNRELINTRQTQFCYQWRGVFIFYYIHIIKIEDDKVMHHLFPVQHSNSKDRKIVLRCGK